MSKLLNFSIECTGCGKKVYFDCPQCGKRHFVQIDNDESLIALGNTKRLVKELSYSLANGRHLSDKQKNKKKKKIDSAKDRLSNLRLGLMKKYNGEMLYYPDGKSFVISFTIC